MLDYYMAGVLPVYVSSHSSASSSRFHKPSKSACENGGGEWLADDDECGATWEEAKNICTLPTQLQWGEVITDCGGVVNDYWSNQDNPAYFDCIARQGYLLNGYWTSEEYSVSDAHVVYFPYGTVDGWLSKGYPNYLRCSD